MTAPVSVLQEIPVPTLVLDAATGCLRAANPAMCELAGWAAQEVASCSLFSLQLWDDPMEVSHMLRQLQDGAALVGYPCRIRRGSDRLAVLVHGAFSVLEGAACITLCFTDVSEYLDAQRVTQAHEALISRGLGAASVATWEWDAASGAFAFSAHWDSMLGHPRNDAVPAGGGYSPSCCIPRTAASWPRPSPDAVSAVNPWTWRYGCAAPVVTTGGAGCGQMPRRGWRAVRRRIAWRGCWVILPSSATRR